MRRVGVWAYAIVGLTVASAPVFAQQLPPEVVRYADVVFVNGKVLTADAQFTIAQAVAVRDGKFMAVGETDRILAMAGPATRKIDLQGKTLTPGIFDLHGGPSGPHFGYWGRKWIPDEPDWHTKAEALEGTRKAVARAKPGEAVVIPRTELKISEDPADGSPPDFCELDAVSPNNPVFFVSVINTTAFTLNTKAAEAIARFMPKDKPQVFLKPNMPCVGRQSQNGDAIPTPGQLATGDFIYWNEDENEMLELTRKDVRKFLEAGVTLGKQHMAPPLMNGLLELWRRGELEMRMRMPFPMVPQICRNSTCLQADDPMTAETLFRRWPNLSRIGDDMLRFPGMRIPALGGNISWGTSWSLVPKKNPYPDPLGRAVPYGGRVEESDGAFRGRDVLIEAVRFGWDVSCDHCEGDKAIREAVLGMEEGLKDQLVHRPDQRLTTNHTPMVHPAEIEKMAKLGIWSSISTGHFLGQKDNVVRSVYQYGADYVANTAPFKSYIRAGMHPALEGTMWPQARTAFFWISKAITRTDEHPKFGRVWGTDEAITRQEALWGVTLWAAEQLGEAKYLGSIEVGKGADVVVIDRDYMTVPPDAIKNSRVLLTMVAGKIVVEVPKEFP